MLNARNRFMHMKLKPAFKDKKLVVFDLDGTLTPSKAPIRRDMVQALGRLLQEKKVAVIGGGKYDQFLRQFVGKAKFSNDLLPQLHLFPTSASAYYRWRKGWERIYAHELPVATKKAIMSAFAEVFKGQRYKHPKKIYGPLIEDRGTQISFSAVGQKAPLPVKTRWNKNNNRLRARFTKILEKKLPGLSVRMGGLTTIDITRKGIDKAYGIRQITKALGISRRDMLFVGDAIYPGGNDYAVVRAGVDYVKVAGPDDTKKVIRFLLGKS